MKLKNYILLSFLLLTCCNMINAQEFSTVFYVITPGDASIDSVVIGYDPNATQGIDAQFGEVDYGLSIDTTKLQIFVRGDDQGRPVLMRKQIVNKTGSVADRSVSLLIPIDSLAVLVRWNHTDFFDSDREHSFITDWPKNWWFDTHKPFISRENLRDTGYFALGMPTEDYYERVECITGSDSKSHCFALVHVIFSGDTIVTSVTPQTSNAINIYPNPVINDLYIDNLSNETIEQVTLYSPMGETIFTGNQSIDRIDFSSYNRGIYLLVVKTKSNIYKYKVIKQ